MSKRYNLVDATGHHVIVKLASEGLTFGFNFGPRLSEGETLEEIESITLTPLDGAAATLTHENETITAEVFVDEGDSSRTIAVGEGVTVRLIGGTAGKSYDVEVVVLDSDGDTKAGRVRLDVY